MKTYSCPKGHGLFTIGKQVFAKLGGVLGGGAIGGAGRDLWGMIVGMVIGGFIGHYIDEAILSTCPECGTTLQLIDALLA